MSARELLWIVPKWPFPAQDGARVATCQLLRNLTRNGHQIDLLAVAGFDENISADEAQSALGVRHVFVVTRAPTETGAGLRRLLSLSAALARDPAVPLTFKNYATREVRDAVSAVFSGDFARWTRSAPSPARRPDWFGVVYDGLHPAIHSSKSGLYAAPGFPSRVIYRAHNVEADIWKRKAERTGFLPLRAFFAHQAARVAHFERSLLDHASGTAPVSDDDWKGLRELSPAARGRVVPIGHDFGALPAPAPESGALELLFLGRLDWPPNREGLEWFLTKVWPQAAARRLDLKLLIAGSGSSDWLAPLLPGSLRTEFLGRVAELGGVYHRSAVSLVPIFYGSGTRVKVIEASRYGRACLSTALGVEGTGLTAGSSYLRAETDAEWIEALAALSLGRARDVGVAAFERMKSRFDTALAALEFERLLDECA